MHKLKEIWPTIHAFPCMKQTRIRVLSPISPVIKVYSPPSPTYPQSSSDPQTMADQQHYTLRRPSATASFIQKLRQHAPNSTQLVGLATLVISGGILLLLTGLTLTVTVLGLIFFTPMILISCPIWFPLGTLLFIAVAGFLSFFGFGVAAAAAASWLYRYFRGFNPPGSDRVDYARTRIADTASHVKDCAREYGGYLHGKVKDAAPGA
ncbi:oleosin 1-like [Dorcoceras hygrometricum]|uniref:Oleosin 1-like n=1 Tax=Dorcoceras hygrometricum TaxID=472368 RepID=A0A2Z7BY47_9LAMI|nr:oleosin 1-like [Dorcoceras hygrometricum]